jgi:hypothetical protein
MIGRSSRWWCAVGVALACVVALSGCCAYRCLRYGSVIDTFERYVIVGYDRSPKCPIPGDRIARLVTPGEPLPIWVRCVFRDNVCKPVKNVVVSFAVVDSFGADVQMGAGDVTLSPTSLKTVGDGFGETVVHFATSLQGHYRIRATYSDKDAVRSSYGPVIIVQR